MVTFIMDLFPYRMYETGMERNDKNTAQGRGTEHWHGKDET